MANYKFTSTVQAWESGNRWLILAGTEHQPIIDCTERGTHALIHRQEAKVETLLRINEFQVTHCVNCVIPQLSLWCACTHTLRTYTYIAYLFCRWQGDALLKLYRSSYNVASRNTVINSCLIKNSSFYHHPHFSGQFAREWRIHSWMGFLFWHYYLVYTD